MDFRLLWLALPLLCTACGCQKTNDLQASMAPAHIIIGFDETVTSPDAQITSSLSRELGCELQPLQALGGNAYVYNCATADTAESLTQKLENLGRHKGVRYAEMDRKRRIQN
jgi:hypothetical protein